MKDLLSPLFCLKAHIQPAWLNRSHGMTPAGSIRPSHLSTEEDERAFRGTQ